MTIELSTLGGVIKTAYEAQPDTHALTDALRARLLDALPQEARGAAMGVAELDAAGMVPMSRLNVSGLAFQGAYNPSTNTPALVDGVGVAGHFYKASVAGTRNFGNGQFTFLVGDWVIFAGGTWQRIGVSDAVAMVNGKVGNVVLTAADVGALPANYVPPEGAVVSVNGKAGAVVLNAADVGALPSTYTPPVAPIPKLTYVNRFFSRVASAWYTNTSAYDRIVNISTNFATSSAVSMINMRAPGTTTPVLSARSPATGTGSSNQVMQAIVPAGWEYQFAPGTSREVSTWFEGDYA